MCYMFKDRHSRPRGLGLKALKGLTKLFSTVEYAPKPRILDSKGRPKGGDIVCKRGDAGS